MKPVVQPSAREHIDSRGGAVYVWARSVGCCRGRTHPLESATEPPDREFELVHTADGLQLFTSRGLVQPDEIHLERSRRGRLLTYWNGQGWFGCRRPANRPQRATDFFTGPP